MVTVWVGFIAFVLLMLALDLGVFHRSAHVVSVREALKWSGIWIAMGLTFSVFVYFAYEDHWFGLGLVAMRSMTSSTTALPPWRNISRAISSRNP